MLPRFATRSVTKRIPFSWFYVIDVDNFHPGFRFKRIRIKLRLGLDRFGRRKRHESTEIPPQIPLLFPNRCCSSPVQSSLLRDSLTESGMLIKLPYHFLNGLDDSPRNLLYLVDCWLFIRRGLRNYPCAPQNAQLLFSDLEPLTTPPRLLSAQPKGTLAVSAQAASFVVDGDPVSSSLPA
jgi:hypothetical protein